MNTDILILLIKSYTIEFIAILTFLVSMLSWILSIIEYFRLKGKWDFYYLDDVARRSVRNGFHPEYLMTSLFIIGSMIFIITNQKIRNLIDNVSNAIFIILITTGVIYIAAYIVFYIFSRADVEKGIYNDNEYYSVLAEKTMFTTVKYFLQLIIFYIIYKAIITSYYIEIIPCIIVSGLLMVIFEYCISKIRTSKNRIYDIIQYNGKDYCILGSTNSDKYYIVNIKIENDVLELFLDTRILIESNGIETNSNSYKKIVRIYNGNVIENGKYYIG